MKTRYLSVLCLCLLCCPAAVSAEELVDGAAAEDAPALVRLLYTVVNALGFNAGKARNADDAAARKRL